MPTAFNVQRGYTSTGESKRPGLRKSRAALDCGFAATLRAQRPGQIADNAGDRAAHVDRSAGFLWEFAVIVRRHTNPRRVSMEMT